LLLWLILLPLVKTADDDKRIALFASRSRVSALLQWIRDNGTSMHGAHLVAPSSLVLLFKLDFQLNKLHIEAISDQDNGVDDIMVAHDILQHKIVGVIYFHDGMDKNGDFQILTRACNAAQIPFAVNEATASNALRGVVKTKTAFLIFNPVAGQGQSSLQLQQIRALLEPRMILHVVMTQKDRECADQAREIVNMIKATPEYEKDPESTLIIASGGDGTVSAVAGETMGTGIPFGVIPRGTANAFSVALDIPVEVDEACQNILNGHVLTVDGAMCNDIPMILLAGLGFEAGMVDNASRELKNVLGTLAYVLGGAKQMLDQQPFHCRVDIDGTSQNLETTAITIANVAPATSVLAQGFGKVVPDDGYLDVTIATPKTFLSGLTTMAQLLTSAVVKEPTDSDTLLCVHAKNVTVDCNPPQKVVIDGEILEVNPIDFSIVPGGLKVIAPRK
jgi:YegS/Rv2252/BmrU family lipid kinase